MMNIMYSGNIQSNEILSNPDVKQRILMMTSDSKNKQFELTKEQKKQIRRNFAAMFYALTVIHWCNGATLGAAMQRALETMSSFVKSKTNPENPMSIYLHELDSEYRRKISERIMTGKYSDSKIELNENLAQKWAKLEIESFKKAIGLMNNMYKQLMPNKSNVAQNFYNNIAQNIQLQNSTNERAA